MVVFNRHILKRIKRTAKKVSIPIATIALSAAKKEGSRHQALNAEERWLKFYQENKTKRKKSDLSRRHA